MVFILYLFFRDGKYYRFKLQLNPYWFFYKTQQSGDERLVLLAEGFEPVSFFQYIDYLNAIVAPVTSQTLLKKD